MAKTLREELQQSKPFASLEVEAYLNVVRTHAVLSQRVIELFKTFGVTETVYNVLRIVRGGPPEGTPCSAVAGRLLTRVPDVTRLVDRAVHQGLIARTRPETDRRLVLLTLTQKGRTLLEKMDEPLVVLQNEIMGGLSKKELETVVALMTKLRHANQPE